MEATTYLQGVLLGLSIAAPVGPIGLLCIRRTLAGGRLEGLLSGLGAATADALYGAVAALGLGAVSSALIAHMSALRLAGGLLLLYLGLRTLRQSPPDGVAPADCSRGPMGAYATTFLLTLTNPMTILSFGGAILGLGAVASGIWLVMGVFTGSALWWLLLSTLVGTLRRRVTPAALRWANRVAGLALLGFGLAAIGGVI